RYQSTQWIVQFNCLSGPEQPRLTGTIAEVDPNSVTEEQLIAVLEEALILDVLDRADEPLTAPEIACRTGIEEGAVVDRIAEVADSIIEVFPPSTPVRYQRR